MVFQWGRSAMCLGMFGLTLAAGPSVYGQDLTPPRIVSVDPAPGVGVVDQVGLQEVRVGFDETVTVPFDAVEVWTVAGGTVKGITTDFDFGTNVLTITLPGPIQSDRVTEVIDYSVTDIADNPLDGEIDDPANASLPSGNDQPGGQAVFRINVLQGDANRDGVVDENDAAVIVASMGFCQGIGGFDPNADLNRDGCVNVLDVSIYQNGFGSVLPATDGEGPEIDSRADRGPFRMFP